MACYFWNVALCHWMCYFWNVALCHLVCYFWNVALCHWVYYFQTFHLAFIMRVKHMAQPYGKLLLQIRLKLCVFCSSIDSTEQSVLNPEDEGTMIL